MAFLQVEDVRCRVLEDREKLAQIVQLSGELAEVNDLDVLLERILSCSRRAVNAEAGSIYTLDGNHLQFCCTQNERLQAALHTGRKLAFSQLPVPIDARTIAGYTALTGESLNIPDVYALPESSAYAFDSKFDRISGYRTRSMLTVALQTSRGKVLGVLQVMNAWGSEGGVRPFSASDEALIHYFGNAAAIALERAQMTRALILRMISLAELRDPEETGAHVNRVGAYSVIIFECWAHLRDLSQDETDRQRDALRMAAMLHDVGKVAITDAILKKPGKLTADEYKVMKRHTYLGARLFADSNSELDEAAAAVALRHHENWDGTGYPGHINVATGVPMSGFEREDGTATGLKGEEIPVFGRVVRVADVYDALCSKRTYKNPMPEEQALAIMHGDVGKAFAPDVFEALTSSLDRIHHVAERYVV